MFENIGNKIKTLAKVLCWIGIIVSVVVAIVLFASDDDLVGIGFLVLIGGSLISWIASFVLFGFGQLVENSDIIAEQSYRDNQKYHKIVKNNEEKKDAQRKKEIIDILNNPSFSDDEYIDIVCPNCREKLSFTKSEILSQDELYCPMCDSAIVINDYKK